MNIIEKIKNLVMSVKSYDFAVLKLTNGTTVETDTEALEIGSIVSVVAEDGSKTLAPVGPHTLADGRTIVLDEDSKVTEIKEADAPTAAEEQMALEVDAELVDSISQLIKAKSPALVEDEVTALATEIIQTITAYDVMTDEEAEAEDVEGDSEVLIEMKKKIKEMSEMLFEVVKTQQTFNSTIEEKISKIPTGKLISEMTFDSEEESPSNDILEARINILKNLNK